MLPLLQKLKTIYLLWYGYYQTLPKSHRFTLGQRIDTLFIEIIEATSCAGFLKPTEKTPYLQLAIRKLDTLKILLMIMWETKSLDNKKYITLSLPLNEIGKMLGGWYGKTIKTSPSETLGKK
ncbi:MAG: four helix bundle protein [Patescibacteria group bacterium]